MDGVGGYGGWRWIFILEGLVTVIVGAIAFFVIYDFPETASFLSPQERAWVVKRLKYQGCSGTSKYVAEEQQFSWKFVRDAFTDWQIYLALISKSRNLIDLSVADASSVLGHCMPAVWNLIFPSYHHQGSRLFVLCRPVAHGSSMHHVPL
jgi:hypothetical protein